MHTTQLSQKAKDQIIMSYTSLKTGLALFKKEMKSTTFGSSHYCECAKEIRKKEEHLHRLYACHQEIIDSHKANTMRSQHTGQLQLEDAQKLKSIQQLDKSAHIVQFAFFGSHSNKENCPKNNQAFHAENSNTGPTVPADDSQPSKRMRSVF